MLTETLSAGAERATTQAARDLRRSASDSPAAAEDALFGAILAHPSQASSRGQARVRVETGSFTWAIRHVEGQAWASVQAVQAG